MIALVDKSHPLSQPALENHLRERRLASGFSQQQLAISAGVTRQAVSAIEANRYSPATSVALQLARALQCRVEDLFRIKSDNEILDGEFIGTFASDMPNRRAQVTRIGGRVLIRPIDGAGELASLRRSADGLITGMDAGAKRVIVKLLKNDDSFGQQAVVGGCDPAMFVAAEHLRHRNKINLAPFLMGNSLALAALKRSEVHAIGVHFIDEHTGARNLADVMRGLGALDCTVVTFAHWEEGLIVRHGNPKNIRAIADLARPNVRIINREKGSGARRLIDGQMAKNGIARTRIKGYSDEVPSHLEIAARIRTGMADAGIGVRSAAVICGVDFIPLQRERYDLVIPKTHLDSLESLRMLLDLIVSKPFRDELEALGGYDTRDTGKTVEIRQ